MDSVTESVIDPDNSALTPTTCSGLNGFEMHGKTDFNWELKHFAKSSSQTHLLNQARHTLPM